MVENRGTGAGGSSTTKNGRLFENQVSLNEFLLENDFIPSQDCIKLETNNMKMVYTCQHQFRKFMKSHYNRKTIRNPDEIIILYRENQKPILFVIEIKNQNREGSIETKLWACDALRFEYEQLYGDLFDIHYFIVVNDFLKEKFNNKSNIKFQILKSYYEKNKIELFYGQESRYHSKLINSIIF